MSEENLSEEEEKRNDPPPIVKPLTDDRFVGSTVEAAKTELARMKHVLREVKINGVAQVTTRDYNAMRVNVESENGIVVNVTGRG